MTNWFHSNAYQEVSFREADSSHFTVDPAALEVARCVFRDSKT